MEDVYLIPGREDGDLYARMMGRDTLVESTILQTTVRN